MTISGSVPTLGSLKIGSEDAYSAMANWSTKEILDDLANLIKELDDKEPDVWAPDIKNCHDKWELSSSLINSIEYLKIDGFSWNPKNFFDSIFDKQIQILDALEKNNRVIINKILKFAGVSSALIVYAYHYARNNTDGNILYVSKHDFDLRKAYNLFSRFAENNCYKDKNIITLKNGASIRFCSEESPLDLTSVPLDVAIIDDANEMIKIENTVNNILYQLRTGGKLVGTRWQSFAFKGWYEV